MTETTFQLDLFHQRTLNTTYEVKREMRLGVSRSHLSREQIVDRMNEIAVAEGMHSKISKATLDNWLKDSDPGRLPSPAWLTIFCHVVCNTGPITAMLYPLGSKAIDEGKQRLLSWAEAEMEKKKAARKARLALEGLEV